MLAWDRVADDECDFRLPGKACIGGVGLAAVFDWTPVSSCLRVLEKPAHVVRFLRNRSLCALPATGSLIVAGLDSPGNPPDWLTLFAPAPVDPAAGTFILFVKNRLFRKIAESGLTLITGKVDKLP